MGSGLRLTRGLLGAAGIVLVLVGAYHLLGTSFPDLVNIVLWLAGGVIAHDAVIAPLVVLVAVVVLPRLPSWGRAPAVAGDSSLITSAPKSARWRHAAGPAKMADDFLIDLPLPRTLDMKTHEAFGVYTRRIYKLLGMD